jgi:3'-5' exoribonuclease
MTHRFINQLTDREPIDDVFLVADKQLRTNRQGNLYLQMRLSDRTGSVTAMMWNANEKVYRAFENGDYLHVEGKAQFYNGAMQVIASGVERVPAAEVDNGDFVTLGPADVESLAARLSERLRNMSSYALRDLAECFLTDEVFMDCFVTAPAGIKHHHAYRGGLLQHVVSLMELTAVVAPQYPEIDPDLLLMGAFLHDVGKIRELTYDRDLAYSDEGQLVGHLVIGVDILDRKVRETERLSGEEFPRELLLRLKHMIVSHHGEYEFGSPKLPMTLEALALHYLDNLDSKMHSVGQLMRDDANEDSDWTPYHAHLGRKLFKGQMSAEPQAAEET